MNNIFKTAGIFLLISLLASCKITKDISATDSPLPPAYRDAASTDSTGIAAIEWKSFFADKTLLQLIDSAVSNNLDMQDAMKNMEAASLTLRQAKLGYLPEAMLQVGASINRPSDNSLNGLTFSQFLGKSYLEDYNAGLSFSWEADVWGKIKNRKAKALAEYLQTGEAKKLLQTNLVASIANGYYNLLMLDEQLSVAHKNLLLNDSTIRILQLRFDAGDVTALAIQQASAQRLVAAQLVPFLQQQIAVQENAISILSGAAPKQITNRNSLRSIVLPAELSAGVPALLLANRPDIRTNELAVRIANANVALARAGMYPSLSITGTTGINSLKASNWFSVPASLFGIAAGSIAQPLFQRKALRTQYEVSKIQRERSVLAFRASVLNAVGEVSDALVKNEKVKEQEAQASMRVATLQKAISNADLLFRNGMATYLEVITAQSNSLQGELDLAALKKDQLDAVVALYRALGGGWK